ncbi:MAG: hypothetical protein QM737_01445 [Ferruginibacter sp.]
MECVQESVSYFGFPKALVDELSGEFEIKCDYNQWAFVVHRNTGIQFGYEVGDVTGEILSDSESELHTFWKSKKQWNGWDLTLRRYLCKLSGELERRLYIKGNPSKIYYDGKNYANVPLLEFNKILTEFANAFCLKLENVKPAAPTEASITLQPDPEVLLLSKEILRERIFSGKADKEGDDRYEVEKNKAGDLMGYKFKHGHFTNKIYLPALKFREPLNSIRIELRFDKIQSLFERTSITSWADLVKPEGHLELCRILLESLDKTIIVDPSLRRNIRSYPAWLNEMIYEGKKAEYWINRFPYTASDKTLKERLMKYRELSYEKGEGLHIKLRLLIERECDLLRKPSSIEGTELGGTTDILNIKNCNKQETEMNTETKLRTTGNSYIYSNMNKKQMAKFKRMLKQDQYNRFSIALKETLERLAA